MARSHPNYFRSTKGHSENLPDFSCHRSHVTGHFRDELYRIMQEAVREGRTFVDVNAGEVHAGLGGYPGRDHGVPVCCKVMREEWATDYGDKILQEPPRGQGVSLTIRYILPRPK